ncbi:hypothetical protein NPIL_662191 [Nephila pilipes]|uniref:Uncharacterized protein n=1 Tax=Nephila pilipes TaxID=299642 RepID=A0A8X6INM3_NEPPI|nr:hypothetical protein NPIL_662191 [Nephila pilipes]
MIHLRTLQIAGKQASILATLQCLDQYLWIRKQPRRRSDPSRWFRADHILLRRREYLWFQSAELNITHWHLCFENAAAITYAKATKSNNTLLATRRLPYEGFVWKLTTGNGRRVTATKKSRLRI